MYHNLFKLSYKIGEIQDFLKHAFKLKYCESAVFTFNLSVYHPKAIVWPGDFQGGVSFYSDSGKGGNFP